MTATAILTKTCPKCEEEKFATEFYRDKTKNDGLSSSCKTCAKAAAIANYAANADRIKAGKIAYRAENPEKMKAYDADRYAKDPSKKKASSAKWTAGNISKVRKSKAEYRANNANKIKAAKALYRLNNLDKVKAGYAAWRAKNLDFVRAYSASWKSNNPDKVKASSALYYAANITKIKALGEAWYLANAKRRCDVAAKWRAENKEATRLYKQNRRAKQRDNGGKLSQGLVSKLFELQKGKCPCCGKPLGDDYHLDHRMPIALGGDHADSNMQLLRATCNMQKSAKHPVDFMRSRGFLI